MIITICGRIKYQYHMMMTYNELSQLGHIVLLPVFDRGCLEINQLKELHFKKIEMSDAICIVGEKYGNDTQKEIEFAEDLGKQILRFNNGLILAYKRKDDRE